MSKPQESLTLSNFVGQEAIKKALRERVELAKLLSAPHPHLLLGGPPEMGKVTLAKAVANEMGVAVTSVLARDINKRNHLAASLAAVRPRELLVIEDIELLRQPMLDNLISALSEYYFELVVGAGPGARSHRIPCPRFTMVGTTSKLWQVDNRLRRWCLIYDLARYDVDQLAEVLTSLARQQGISLAREAARLLAGPCHGRPGNAAVLVKRIYMDCGSLISGEITPEQAQRILKLLGYGEEYPSSVSISDKLCNMSGVEFEQWVAQLFRQTGHTVELTRSTGDHGVDLLMRKGNSVIAVQCKRWADPIGEPVVRDFYGSLLSVGAFLGYIVAPDLCTPAAH